MRPPGGIARALLDRMRLGLERKTAAQHGTGNEIRLRLNGVIDSMTATVAKKLKGESLIP